MDDATIRPAQLRRAAKYQGRSTIVFGRGKSKRPSALGPLHPVQPSQQQQQQHQGSFVLMKATSTICSRSYSLAPLFKPTWLLALFYFLLFPQCCRRCRCHRHHHQWHQRRWRRAWLFSLSPLRRYRRVASPPIALVPVSAIRHVRRQSFRGHLGPESTTVQIDFLSAPFCASPLILRLSHNSVDAAKKKKKRDHHIKASDHHHHQQQQQRLFFFFCCCCCCVYSCYSFSYFWPGRRWGCHCISQSTRRVPLCNKYSLLCIYPAPSFFSFSSSSSSMTIGSMSIVLFS